MLPQGLAPWSAAPEGNRFTQQLQVYGLQTYEEVVLINVKGNRIQERDERVEIAAERSVPGRHMVHNCSRDQSQPTAETRDQRRRGVVARHMDSINSRD